MDFIKEEQQYKLLTTEMPKQGAEFALLKCLHPKSGTKHMASLLKKVQKILCKVKWGLSLLSKREWYFQFLLLDFLPLSLVSYFYFPIAFLHHEGKDRAPQLPRVIVQFSSGFSEDKCE